MSVSNHSSAYNNFIGIDISKYTLDCSMLFTHERILQKKRIQVTNNFGGFTKLIEWLEQNQAEQTSSVICLEHTGVYNDRLVKTLTEAGWMCALENTTITRKVSHEHHRKDDIYDSDLIAEYAMRYNDRLNIHKDTISQVDQLRLLHNQRRRLKTQIASLKQHIGETPWHSVEVELIQLQWQQQLELFEKQLESIDEAIDRVIASHKDLSFYFELLMSIRSVGRVTATLWLILFYGQGKLNAKKIASRYGHAPHGRESGLYKGKSRSTGHGKGEMRKVMTMCARSARMHNDKMKAYKDKKINEGKPSKLVTNNIINKQIRIMCAVWNSKQKYDPNHVSRFNMNLKAAS